MTIEEIRERVEKATPGPWAYGEFKTADRPDGALLIGPKFKSTKSGVMYRVEDANFITHAREDIPALLAEIDRLKAGLNAVQELINDSHGVIGLHLNGDVAPWDSLLEGGYYEDWLLAFGKAMGGL